MKAQIEPLTYPDTLYAPRLVHDLSDSDERRKLSGAGLRTAFKIANAWKLQDAEARALLGDISNGLFYQLKTEAQSPSIDRTLSSDVLARISLIIGIYKALHTLYSDDLPDRWMTIPNRNIMFGEQRPVDYAIRGGILALSTIRRLLGARCSYPG